MALRQLHCTESAGVSSGWMLDPGGIVIYKKCQGRKRMQLKMALTQTVYALWEGDVSDQGWREDRLTRQESNASVLCVRDKSWADLKSRVQAVTAIFVEVMPSALDFIFIHVLHLLLISHMCVRAPPSHLA